MNVNERRVIFYHELTEETPFCVNCGHYHPHYVRESVTGRIMPIDCGHCVCPHLKSRRAYDTCEHFEKKNQTVK